VSYSWVDPHFALLYERREDQRLAERLLAAARARPERLPELGATEWRRSGWLESDAAGNPAIRLI
jgi:hypothetical protein